ncbi:hypothetical protein OQA88_5291 [Cercophora sp. LCS_1]
MGLRRSARLSSTTKPISPPTPKPPTSESGQPQPPEGQSIPFGTLSRFPPEILVSIINSDLDIPTLTNLRLVNHDFKRLIDTSIPDYTWLRTNHPFILRALFASNVTHPSCNRIRSILRAKRCTVCDDNRGDAAAPTWPFKAYLSLAAFKFVCKACYLRPLVPPRARTCT